jgi:hypothetical protein
MHPATKYQRLIGVLLVECDYCYRVFTTMEGLTNDFVQTKPGCAARRPGKIELLFETTKSGGGK